MEAVLLNSPPDRSISSQKQLRNAKKSNRILTSSNLHGGILHAPPLSLSYSYPPSVSVFHPPPRQQQQPPLLPLPIPKPSSNPRNRGISRPPINKKINNKSKCKPTLGQKKADAKQVLKSSEFLVVPSGIFPFGPEPNNLPKDLFTLSPPPSSLPLPTFSLRPKLSCNAEAAEIDAGATDNLRRLLRLR